MKGLKGTKGRSGCSEFWRKHIEAWVSSGSTQAEYCRRQDLRLSAFGYWKRRLAMERAAAGFVEVRPWRGAPQIMETVGGAGPFPFPRPVPGKASGMRLLIEDEFAIELCDGFNPETLRSLVGILRDLP